MSYDDPALLAEFVTESREHLAEIEGQLLQIESAGADIDDDLVNQVFRAIHSIKGAAGFMGLTRINELSHSLENVLGKVRNHELIPTTEIVDVMLRAADELTGMINNIENSNDVDVSGHVVLLDKIFEDEQPVKKELVEPIEPEIVAPEEVEVPLEPKVEEQQPVAETPPAAEPKADDTAKKSAAPVANTTTEASVRVQVGVLDRLMNLAGELVLGRNQLLQNLHTTDQGSLQTVAARLDQVTSELQDAIMQTRMQPIGNVFNKFPRVVRDLSAKLGKHCNVVVEGNEVEVDKTIIEAIGDPLTHMVRNSVDHGVESPDKRVSQGKDPTGTVKLRAYHQAGKVRIDVGDNGGGIDTDRLKQKAVEKEIISKERAQQMTHSDALWLIFHPGFSTADKLSDVSGRGVGMDVVRTNIEKIGGSVDIDSELGKGTTIQITLPLTLAIIPSMLVRCRSRRFAVPQINIVELVRVRKEDGQNRIAEINGAPILRLRGTLLPLVELSDVLDLGGSEEKQDDRYRHIAVVESGQFRYGLVVDEIDDSEEIVVKPLGRHLKSCSCLAGATILGDGHVAPILDVSGIAAKQQLRQQDKENSITASDSLDPEIHDDMQSLLLLSNSPQEVFAIPMSLISRIERVRSDQVDTVGGQQLLQYRGASLPLLALEDYIQTKPRPESDLVHIIVFQIYGREIGLIANEIKDIREIAAKIDGDTFREPGIAGSMVIDDHTTRLVDLFELAQAAHPSWFAGKTQSVKEHPKSYSILLVEDSSFFRKQAQDYLESEDFDVIPCEDGQEAWEFLLEDQGKIDLVITDIEMPRMNGFELSRLLKNEPNFCHLPIIALTSLASEEDRNRGLQAGIDDYQVKIDRERVMTAIQRLLNISNDPKHRRKIQQQQTSEQGCV